MANLASYVGLLFSQIITFLLAIIFLYSSLVINFIEALLYCGLRPFSKTLYRKIIFYLSRSCLSQLVFLAVWWSPTDIIIYVNEEEWKKYYYKETILLIPNHHYDLDWLIGFVIFEYGNMLGNLKAYMKRSNLYFPTFGWNLFFGDNIGLLRDSGKWKQSLIHKLEYILDYDDPSLLVLYPEGTRFTEKKWIASKKFAEERGLPFLKYHLLPRPSGFTTSISCFSGKVNAVYNIQFCFKRGERPTLKDILLRKKIQAHVYFERIPIDQIPIEEELCKKWLYNFFQVKDRLSDSFFETGDFFEKSGVKRVESFHLPRPYFPLFNEIGWAIVVLSSMGYGLFHIVVSGSTTSLILVSAVLCISIWFIKIAIDATDTTKGSSYGCTNSPVKEKTS